MLIVRLGAFGDVVRTLPAAYALRLRHPDAHLAWLVEPAAAALLERLPWLDEVVVFGRADLEAALAARRAGALLEGIAAVRRRLRAERFDAVVDFHGGLKSGLLSWFTGAPRRVGLARPDAREGAQLFYNERVSLGADPRPRWLRNAALAARFGAEVDNTVVVPGLRTADTPRQRGGHAVVHPGSSPGTPYKRYPTGRLVDVVRRLASELGEPCRITCGASEAERGEAEALVALAGGAARLEPTGGRVGALIDALATARVVVSGDTGPLHLASLVGTPVVQILGPTHPVQNEPWPGTSWARAHLPLPCSPCRRGCDAAPCLGLLPVGDVMDAVRRVLEAAPAGESDAIASGAAVHQPQALDRPQTPDEPQALDRPQTPDEPQALDRPQAPAEPPALDRPQAPAEPPALDRPQAPIDAAAARTRIGGRS